MKKVFDKQPLGIEDLEIGNAPIKQIRNGEEVELEPINTLYDAGLLKDLDREKIPVGVEVLWFKGFYEEGDDGQGMYIAMPEDEYYYSERQDDVGLYIKANGVLYEREGSWNKYPEGTAKPLEGEKRHFIMFEWYGARSNDDTYNCFWILEHAYKTIYIKTIELKANKHYYFKQYTDITISRTSSLEVRGNNAYMHFAIFAGQFDWEIPTILEYIIFRDINYSGIVPEFSFDGSKCKYFNIYHNSNIQQPTGRGYVYKKDDQDIIGEMNVTELPIIEKVNEDENAIVNKAYVDKLSNMPDNLVKLSDDISIDVYKQASVKLDRSIPIDELDDNDLVTEVEVLEWISDNINSLYTRIPIQNIIPIGYEYLQFKANIITYDNNVSFIKLKNLYYYYFNNSWIKVDVVNTDTDTFTCIISLNGQSIEVLKDNTIISERDDFSPEETPEILFGGAWRLNKEENDIRYWEKV